MVAVMYKTIGSEVLCEASGIFLDNLEDWHPGLVEQSFQDAVKKTVVENLKTFCESVNLEAYLGLGKDLGNTPYPDVPLRISVRAENFDDSHLIEAPLRALVEASLRHECEYWPNEAEDKINLALTELELIKQGIESMRNQLRAAQKKPNQ
jgi:hypothetical protein